MGERQNRLSAVKNKAAPKPQRMVIHGLEGSGKTTLGAYVRDPIFVCTRGETGIETLLANNLVGPTPYLPECVTWDDLNETIKALLDEKHDYKTLVLDTVNGAEEMLIAHVIATNFKGNAQKFGEWARGNKVVKPAWRQFILGLDVLRAKGMSILLLCHTHVVRFSNPTGPDFDRWEPVLKTKDSWPVLNGFSDFVFFLTFEDEVFEEQSGRGIAKTKTETPLKRVIFTERRAAVDAKNRHGLPPKIYLPEDPADCWKEIHKVFEAAKANRKENGSNGS